MSIQNIITPEPKDLGGFTIQRILPAPGWRSVGPFVFLDHFGPTTLDPKEGIQVRPHPHIGLATLTYLYEGEIIHRDSLGITQAIEKGAVNLMTAGKGIVHSERTRKNQEKGIDMHGLQCWIALPQDKEEIEPAFEHYPDNKIPKTTIDGVTIDIVMGSAYGQHSPVTSYSPSLYLSMLLHPGSSILLPQNYSEIAVYVISGSVVFEDTEIAQHNMVVLEAENENHIATNEESQVLVLGGDNLGERHLWWNFVSSDKERLEQAKQNWKNGLFEKVPGETEFIPLPE